MTFAATHTTGLRSILYLVNFPIAFFCRKIRIIVGTFKPPSTLFTEGRSNFKIALGKPAGKRPLRRTRRGWEDNIRMGLKEIGISTRNWFD